MGIPRQPCVSHCRVLPLGEFNVTIPQPRATLQGARIPSAISKIVFRHISFVLKFSLGFDKRRLSYRLHTLVHYACSGLVSFAQGHRQPSTDAQNTAPLQPSNQFTISKSATTHDESALILP